jgi:RNA polymerase sigma-70 factor (ECF subfamily)
MIEPDLHRPDPGVTLMLAYQAGDESAFDRLVETYSGPVHALLSRFLGPTSDREDLVQEVFLRVIRARERYQPSAKLSTWLYRIAFNLCVNERAKLGSRTEVGVRSTRDGEAGPSLEFADERAEEPEDRLARQDVVRAVRRAIADLPESQRMALILAKYEELPYEEIAQVLGAPSEKAIKSMVHRARERLRTALAPWLQEELA